eukprot:TRINITY_DN10808_c0_g1_i1.p1 TRINITY_DN10808_c0_g1~~TRINITY_DN10808_c0_g1_i1.p1  ORF type:complete len:516 (-),score=84.01 TRINITY_DN10808_c0_g1_i1:88-1635(-)
MNFKRTEILKFPDVREVDPGGEVSDWKRWESPISIQEYGAINKIDISNTGNQLLFAITSYSKVLLYDPVIKDVYKSFSKFQDACYGGKFRRDGKLLSIGTSEGQIKVFDVATKTMLRIFKGHTTAVRRSDFTPDNTHLVSFSDDKNVCIWDLPSEAVIETFAGHTDYVRCGASMNLSSDLVTSGSYDQTVKIWDRRSGPEPVCTINHGAPVEDLVVLPGDALIVTAGGSNVKFWDIAGGGRELVNLSPHHKTVTSLGLADNGQTLLTGSLDRHIKRVDLENFQVTGNLSFPSSILSVGAVDKYVIGGMVDGLIQIHEKRPETMVDGVKKDNKKARRAKNLRYMQFSHFESSSGDFIVDSQDMPIERRFDKFLRKFEYSKALNQTLKPYVLQKKPQYTHSLLYELIRRDGLKTALMGRDEFSQLVILKYLNDNITDVRFSRVLHHVANIMVDLYLPLAGKSSKVEQAFTKLARKLEREIDLVESLTGVQGMLDTVLEASNAGQHPPRVEKEIFKNS